MGVVGLLALLAPAWLASDELEREGAERDRSQPHLVRACRKGSPIPQAEDAVHVQPVLVDQHEQRSWLACAVFTEKVGFSVGLEPVEVGEDPDVKAVVQGLLNA